LRWASMRTTRADIVGLAFMALAIGAIFLPHPPERWSVGTNHFLDCAFYALPTTLMAVALAAIFPSIRPVLQTIVFTVIGLALWIGATAMILARGRSGGWEMAAGLGAIF